MFFYQWVMYRFCTYSDDPHIAQLNIHTTPEFNALSAAENLAILTLDHDFHRCNRPLVMPTSIH